MSRNWTASLTRLLHRGPRLAAYPAPEDADVRRIRGDLDALRARFPDHA